MLKRVKSSGRLWYFSNFVALTQAGRAASRSFTIYFWINKRVVISKFFWECALLARRSYPEAPARSTRTPHAFYARIRSAPRDRCGSLRAIAGGSPFSRFCFFLTILSIDWRWPICTWCRDSYPSAGWKARTDCSLWYSWAILNFS